MSQHQHPGTHVRQYSDQYTCSKCGKIWDVNDPEPPVCETAQVTRGKQWINHIRNILKKDGK